jgi:hypothetical protein
MSVEGIKVGNRLGKAVGILTLGEAVGLKDGD